MELEYIRKHFGKHSQPLPCRGYSMKYNILTNAKEFDILPSHILYVIDDTITMDYDMFYYCVFNKEIKTEIYSYPDICKRMIYKGKIDILKKLLSILNYDMSLIKYTMYLLKNIDDGNGDNEKLKYHLVHKYIEKSSTKIGDQDEVKDIDEESIFDKETSEYHIMMKKEKESMIEEISRIKVQVENKFWDDILKSKNIVRDERRIMYKFIHNRSIPYNISSINLDDVFIGAYTYKDGIKEQYHLYAKDEYPSYETKIERTPGTYIVMSVDNDLSNNKLIQSKSDIYNTNEMGKYIMRSMLNIKCDQKMISYKHKHIIQDNPDIIMEKILKRMNINEKGIIMEKDTIYIIYTTTIIDPVIFMDILQTNEEFKSSCLYDTIYLDERSTPISYRKFVRLKVKYGGISFRLKLVKHKSVKRNGMSGCTKFRIDGINNSMDENIMISYCNALIHVYNKFSDDHKSFYYDEIFDDPYKGIEYNDFNTSSSKTIIGSSRYGKNSGKSMPQLLDPSFDNIDEYIKKGYTIHNIDGKIVATEKDVIPIISRNHKMRTNNVDHFIIKGSINGRSNNRNQDKILSNTGAILFPGQMGKTKGMFSMLLYSNELMRLGIKRSKSSFLSCIFEALDIPDDVEYFRKTKELNFWLTKQEMPYHTIDEIESEFRDTSKRLDSSKYIRLMENYFNCNIIVLRLEAKGRIKLETRMYDDNYIWHPQHRNRYIAIIRNYAIIEGLTYDPPYELLVKAKGEKIISKVFEDERLHNIKLSMVGFRRLRNPIDESKWDYQYVTNNGICKFIGKNTKDGILWMECVDRPLGLPFRNIVDEEICSFKYILNHLEIKDAEVDVIDINGSEYIIGIWDKVYYPTRRYKYKSKYTKGERFIDIDRGYSEMSNIFNDFANKCVYSLFIAEHFTEKNYFKEEYIAKYVCIVDHLDIPDIPINLLDYKGMKKQYPQLFHNGKIKVTKEQESKLRSLLAIVSKNRYAFEQYKDLQTRKEKNKMSFNTFNDMEAWMKDLKSRRRLVEYTNIK